MAEERVTKAPDLNAQVAALGDAFVELARMLGRNGSVEVTQLAGALETKAKALNTIVGVRAALEELARKLRGP